MNALEYHGSKYELLQIIKKLDGVLEDEDHFYCIQRIISGRRHSGIDFRIDCAISETKSGFLIVYRTRPTIATLMTPLLFLLITVACVIAAAFGGESWLNVLILSAASAFFIIMLSVLQKTCTMRFLRAFQKQTTKKKHYR